MKRTVSEMEKVSEQNTEASTSKSSQPPPKKRRGPTRCKNVIDAKTLLPLRVNKFGQPIGLGSGTYTNYLGTLAWKGELAPLCYKTWWEMPKRLKEDMWNIIKEVSKKNKERRGKQTMMHTTGTKSFARVSAEIEEDEGIQLSRADLFICTHVNKDGKATDAVASEMIENIKEFQKSYSDSPIGSSNDLFSIVRGEERTGRVRMLGFGPTPSDVWGPSPSKAELINNTKKSREEARATRVELQ
ncbi:uncharacterized protein LOC132273910 [Cornus florida]|uniref:uncharacterized protein LOC132273910 n=1 Tax=Cornus florida TaxID=4283 RepID=UPI00289B2D7E|nr:uncharacterized protein LOC132273910 [Cornus florida]